MHAMMISPRTLRSGNLPDTACHLFSRYSSVVIDIVVSIYQAWIALCTINSYIEEEAYPPLYLRMFPDTAERTHAFPAERR